MASLRPRGVFPLLDLSRLWPMRTIGPPQISSLKRLNQQNPEARQNPAHSCGLCIPPRDLKNGSRELVPHRLPDSPPMFNMSPITQLHQRGTTSSTSASTSGMKTPLIVHREYSLEAVPTVRMEPVELYCLRIILRRFQPQ